MFYKILFYVSFVDFFFNFTILTYEILFRPIFNFKIPTWHILFCFCNCRLCDANFYNAMPASPPRRWNRSFSCTLVFCSNTRHSWSVALVPHHARYATKWYSVVKRSLNTWRTPIRIPMRPVLPVSFPNGNVRNFNTYLYPCLDPEKITFTTFFFQIFNFRISECLFCNVRWLNIQNLI